MGLVVYPAPASRIVIASVPAAVGPPTTGTAVLGQIYADGQGVEWVCVAAGTPGNWVCSSPGATVDYETATTLVQTTTNSLATAIEVGLLISPDCTGRDPMTIGVQAYMGNTSAVAASNAILSVCDVTGAVTPATTNEVLRLRAPSNFAGSMMLKAERVIIPPLGTRLFKALLWSATTGNTASFNSQTFPEIAHLWIRWT